ncbi:protein phosphatase regulator [Trichosporon asahii var. asahii CBS 2479]|uniref:Protein phosphatase regulator n=1 Tax=Trichosporon asahii var. asahii (strain ATCC 90039 / CBS 2479 / JCM 2466 / KCTC 7840 / NBRC 103889/ NCYC 2677 / UAMH 7654) TaxID=1186058 RepID=J5T9U7_TRIAS|nr:protein phosphatase regulator [Trichosporon asahii var. asahii CBS 2479]EJT49906.1 protein phosphatase regulator [Trichosporon asahii var. asahii CBS 2479]
MPYSSSSLSADTDMVDAVMASERLAEQMPIRVDLRRSASETAVPQLGTTKTQSLTAASNILLHPPTPSPTLSDKTVTTPPAIEERKSPRVLSPRSSALGITIASNVLPAVRSPKRNTEPLPSVPTSRRSRRPRIFGFTGLGDPASPQSSNGSVAGSPTSEEPQPSFGPSSQAMMLPRRDPVRVRSDTSLYSLRHAMSPPPAARTPEHESPVASPVQTPTLVRRDSGPKITPRERRDTGLKLDLGGLVPALPAMADNATSTRYTVIRKKSGEVVKSALKFNGPLGPNGTPLEKRPMFASKSCPTTPNCPKYVHFDPQLERVKLFLQDQKPKVVSRQGSPTEMSEDEDEEEEEPPKKVLHVRMPNFPTIHGPDEDVYLESLGLNEERTALRGVVLCRNIAFEKWVAVRFTFDWWQTVSEVTASYKESIRGGSFDRFQFTLKLDDLLDRIDEKTLFLCIRYNTAGREIWDSNGGQNYHVLFDLKAPKTPSYMPKRTKVTLPGTGKSVSRGTWGVTSADADRMADLRARLNRLQEEDAELARPISPRKKNARFSPRQSSKELPAYDFAAAFNSSKRSSTGTTPRRADSASGSTAAAPATGRRRFAAADFYTPKLAHFGGPISPMPGTDSPTPTSPPMSPFSFANHNPASPRPGVLTPRGSANSSSTASLDSVDTLTATPSDSPSMPIHNVSEESSDATESDTPQPSPLSPSESPLSPSDVLPRWTPSTTAKNQSVDDMSLKSYSTFIEQFCWGGAATGPVPTLDTPDFGRRVHSTSSLDHFFSSPPDSATPVALSRTNTQTGTVRAPSREDLEHVDNAIKSLSISLPSTPKEPSPPISPSLSHMNSSRNSTILAI